jgi:hypothetical protein
LSGQASEGNLERLNNLARGLGLNDEAVSHGRVAIVALQPASKRQWHLLEPRRDFHDLTTHPEGNDETSRSCALAFELRAAPKTLEGEALQRFLDADAEAMSIVRRLGNQNISEA